MRSSLLAVGAFILAAGACSRDPIAGPVSPAPLRHLSGTVYEGGFGSVAGVRVTVEIPAEDIVIMTTDSNGRYTFPYATLHSAVLFSLFKDGYEPITEWVVLSEGGTQDFGIQRPIRLELGITFHTSIYATDPRWVLNFLPGAGEDYCAPCKLLRLRPAPGTVRVVVQWQGDVTRAGVWVGLDLNHTQRLCCGPTLEFDVPSSTVDTLIFVDRDFAGGSDPQPVRIEAKVSG